MLKTLLVAWKESRQIREYIELADQASFWQPIDGAAMVKFFTSFSGQKLRARLANMVFKGALKACGAEENGDYQRGIARGILLTVQAIDQHMDIARQPQEQDFAEASVGEIDNSWPPR